jgi:hypothetical protein
MGARGVPALQHLALQATLRCIDRVQDFTLMPEHVVVELLQVRSPFEFSQYCEQAAVRRSFCMPGQQHASVSFCLAMTALFRCIIGHERPPMHTCIRKANTVCVCTGDHSARQAHTKLGQAFPIF